jgi:hypothetical protein
VPMRGKFGKIEYWVAGATREKPVWYVAIYKWTTSYL